MGWAGLALGPERPSGATSEWAWVEVQGREKEAGVGIGGMSMKRRVWGTDGGQEGHSVEVGGDERDGDSDALLPKRGDWTHGEGTTGARVSPFQHVPGMILRDFLPRWHVELSVNPSATWTRSGLARVSFPLAPPVSVGRNTRQITVDEKVLGKR